MKAIRGFWILVTLFAAACGSSRPSPPSTGSGGTPVSITGRERIGWDQPAADAAFIDALSFAIYVDNTRSEMTDASCDAVAGPAGFSCTGQLPPMPGGTHTLQIAAFTGSGSNLAEGSRSGTLEVIVSAALSAPATSAVTGWETTPTEPTQDGLRFSIEKLADGLDRPIDAAFAADGRLFVLERHRVRVFADGGWNDRAALSLPADDPSQRLLSIAFDPDFSRTRFVFLLQTIDSPDGPLLLLARYRELRGTLGQRAVLFHSSIDADADVAAVMRFGPDGKLYLAIGSGASTGTLLRLNPDGTMPQDQAGTTPAVAGGVGFAPGLAWDPRGSMLWIVDNDAASAHLSGIAMSTPPVRASVRERSDLPSHSGSIVFYTADAIPQLHDNALIASSDCYILRLRFSGGGTEVVGSERLAENRVGPVLVVVAGGDGALYFCTETALGRLAKLNQ